APGRGASALRHPYLREPRHGLTDAVGDRADADGDRGKRYAWPAESRAATHPLRDRGGPGEHEKRDEERERGLGGAVVSGGLRRRLGGCGLRRQASALQQRRLSRMRT